MACLTALSETMIPRWFQQASRSISFVTTRPLFRLDGGQANVIRVVRAGGSLPEDRESLFWLSIKAIPSSRPAEGQNTLQFAARSVLKLIYRPPALSGTPEKRAGELRWQRAGNQLLVTNPTPFYMHFHEIRVGKASVEKVTFVPPMGEARFDLPSGATGTVTWRLINDYGGIGVLHSSSF